MVFFDLSIPYLEGEGGGGGRSNKQFLPDNNARKNARLKVAVKAMELGYSGVAYDRSIKGVMSDNDKCTISLFPLSSLLKLAPSMATTVKFHRDLLGVPLNAPFRQYSRLTVTVDSMIQVSALNSGNPVLKTYDLVAVRPLNQTTFDHVCKVSEVDLIAIDFSLKLPFRLKLPMVKAAIERGVYFEITYSPLISDAQTRRQMVTNSKLLVDWTRGKNLIFSSAASSVNEVRGPYDVANLSSLLGLSMERAKAAVSKNCRSLIASALRKKQFYKDTIKVERISSAEQKDSKEPWFVHLHDWDHISSGEGDLRLEDIAKVFSASMKSKTSKAIDFTSIAEEMPSNGMQLKDWLSGGGKLPLNDTSLLSEAKESADTSKDIRQSVPRNDIPTIITDGMEMETPAFCHEEPMSSNGAVSVAVEMPSQDTRSEDHITASEQNLFLIDDPMEPLSAIKEVEHSTGLNDIDAVLGAHNVGVEEIISLAEGREQTDGGDTSAQIDFATSELQRQQSNDIVPFADEEMLESFHDDLMHGHVTLLADGLPSEGALVVQEDQKQESLIEVNRPSVKESKSGKSRFKRRTYRRALPFPFKSLLKPVVSSKKSRKLKLRRAWYEEFS